MSDIIPEEILNFVYSDTDEELLFEKCAIKSALKDYYKLTSDPKMCIKKNVEESKKYRLTGNELFSKKTHDREIHKQICKFYTQSIALAPNNSNELVMGYINRSSILFHLNKFEECINDCDRGIIVNLLDDYLKVKFKYRKIESLLAMKDERLKAECESVLVFLQESSVIPEVKNQFIKKVTDILNSVAEMTFEKTSTPTVNFPMDLPEFECQRESPCVSEAVILSYNQKWGRHVTATRDIDVGEIITVEKSLFSFLHPSAMYLHCTNCMKSVLSLIPCEHCSHDVYCSDECKSEAWIKYHEYECPVIPFIWEEFKSEKSCLLFLRFMLISVHEAGSIASFKNQVMSALENKSPRTKGFSSNGIFDSTKFQCANSFKNYRTVTDRSLINEFIVITSKTVFYLATETNFFGMKMSKLQYSTMFENEIIVFIGAIILQNYYTLPYNSFTLDVYHANYEVETRYGLSVHPFCNFFNHSCDPNAKHFTSKNNELVIYAKYPIKKGAQVFLCYNYDYLVMLKADRLKNLSDRWAFTCKCIACENDWTIKHLKHCKTILKKKPQLARKIAKLMRSSIDTKKESGASTSIGDNNTIEELTKILQTLAETVTIYTNEYYCLSKYLHKMFIKTYGNWFIEVAGKC